MQDLATLFAPVIESMGYELVGVEYQLNGSYGTLRVYIDREQGVNLDDCAEISHQVSAILDVEDPIQQAYDLEISSPGLDRPLFKLADYERFAGNTVKIKLTVGLDGRRNFKGALLGISDRDEVLVEVDGTEFSLPFADIAKANLVADL